ncbi:hypothetical protein [Dyella psychrodurans]|uniref:Uncharacterized protein n=1 Tax=Dyella psychrodurans TaxID=1927960 RepID=A0A370XA96_9GAMM|nr:hypothetical protein [Dyella psychrodurans]RDS85308.1 hypothetical protein DWU99_07190 [Dyella psychrodurans]
MNDTVTAATIPMACTTFKDRRAASAITQIHHEIDVIKADRVAGVSMKWHRMAQQANCYIL